MKKNIFYSLVIAASVTGIISCNNRNNESHKDLHKDTVNVSDSRRNTTNSSNYITDTAAEATDVNKQSPDVPPRQ